MIIIMCLEPFRETKLLKCWKDIDFIRQVENEEYFIKWKEDLKYIWITSQNSSFRKNNLS